jgi:hypothetical protein
MAAVTTYIKTEEENVIMPPPAPSGPPVWAISGRQEAMQLRCMMQLKAFK